MPLRLSPLSLEGVWRLFGVLGLWSRKVALVSHPSLPTVVFVKSMKCFFQSHECLSPEWEWMNEWICPSNKTWFLPAEMRRSCKGTNAKVHEHERIGFGSFALVLWFLPDSSYLAAAAAGGYWHETFRLRRGILSHRIYENEDIEIAALVVVAFSHNDKYLARGGGGRW